MMRRSYVVAGGLVGIALLYKSLSGGSESARQLLNSNNQQPQHSYITAEETLHSIYGIQNAIKKRLEEANQDTDSKPTLRRPFEGLVNFLELSEEETKENIKHIDHLVQVAESKWLNQSRAQGSGPEKEYTFEDIQRIGKHFFVYQQYKLAQTLLKERKYIVVKPGIAEPPLPSDMSLVNIQGLKRNSNTRYTSDCRFYDLWFPIECEKYPELNKVRLSIQPTTNKQIDVLIAKHNNHVEELRVHKVGDYQRAYKELQEIGNDKTLAVVEKTRGFLELRPRLFPVDVGMDSVTGLLFRKAK